MSTSDTPTERPGDVRATAEVPAPRSRTLGLVLGVIAAAVILLVVGFGLGWFSRHPAAEDSAELRRLRRALAVLAAVRAVLSALRDTRRDVRLVAQQLHELRPSGDARATHATAIRHER
jgi:hypothetical protein